MALYKGSTKIAGGVNFTLSEDISNYSVTFVDDENIPSENISEILNQMTTGNQISKLVSTIKKVLLIINTKISKLLDDNTSIQQSVTQLNGNLSRNLQGWECTFPALDSCTGTYVDITLSESMPDINYMVLTSLYNGGAYWADIAVSITNRTTTGFRLLVWNNGASKCDAFSVLWIASHHRLV